MGRGRKEEALNTRGHRGTQRKTQSKNEEESSSVCSSVYLVASVVMSCAFDLELVFRLHPCRITFFLATEGIA